VFSFFFNNFFNDKVDLKEHQGFRGGLTTDGTSGVVAPYWANERFELIYHVVTYMPTSTFFTFTQSSKFQ
jgi:hypothetical protein